MKKEHCNNDHWKHNTGLGSQKQKTKKQEWHDNFFKLKKVCLRQNASMIWTCEGLMKYLVQNLKSKSNCLEIWKYIL